VVDFQLHTTSGPVIIEVDGREYHDPSRITDLLEHLNAAEMTCPGTKLKLAYSLIAPQT